VGTTEKSLFGAEIPIAGIAGDQQAALVGQACFRHGLSKNTYGTGCFFLMHTGNRPVPSQNRLLTTLAASPGPELEYALEGSVFVAGAAVQWLRDSLGIIKTAAETAALARVRELESRLAALEAEKAAAAQKASEEATKAVEAQARARGRAVDPAELQKAQDAARLKAQADQEERVWAERQKLDEERRLAEEARAAEAAKAATPSPTATPTASPTVAPSPAAISPSRTFASHQARRSESRLWMKSYSTSMSSPG